MKCAQFSGLIQEMPKTAALPITLSRIPGAFGSPNAKSRPDPAHLHGPDQQIVATIIKSKISPAIFRVAKTGIIHKKTGGFPLG